jgi:hydrogenase nickel incorporation protein HypA/HybF
VHELSIAMSLVELAQEEARQRDVQVTGVHVKLGALSGVVCDALRASYEMACFETSLQGTQLLVEEVPVMIYCLTCGANRSLYGVELICPECATPASHIVQGKELQLVALEVAE